VDLGRTSEIDWMGKREAERFFVILFAAAATAVAWVAFARFPVPVRGGTAVHELTLAPVQYQVSVVPAFALFAAFLAVDVVRRRARPTWAPRALLLAVTAALGVVRLHGDVALSGHAVFLCAALAYELVVPVDADAPLVACAVIPALLVTGWYKLAVWGDGAWFAVSVVAGAVLGAALGRWARKAAPR
jgi:hypothetical protein